ncbi:MAG: molecular chaperone DnaJ [Chroococcales cyanobacterium]
MNTAQICPHCEGNGYIQIRDCSGDVQREETCLHCQGTGTLLDSSEED